MLITMFFVLAPWITWQHKFMILVPLTSGKSVRSTFATARVLTALSAMIVPIGHYPVQRVNQLPTILTIRLLKLGINDNL